MPSLPVAADSFVLNQFALPNAYLLSGTRGLPCSVPAASLQRPCMCVSAEGRKLHFLPALFSPVVTSKVAVFFVCFFSLQLSED